MTISVLQRGNTRAAVVESDKAVLCTEQDALDLLATARSLHECDSLIVPKSAVDESFFDLRTGFAGEVLQKFTNYGMRVALIGDFSAVESRALRDFIRESNRVGQTLFLPTAEEALARWAQGD